MLPLYDIYLEICRLECWIQVAEHYVQTQHASVQSREASWDYFVPTRRPHFNDVTRRNRVKKNRSQQMICKPSYKDFFTHFIAMNMEILADVSTRK